MMILIADGGSTKVDWRLVDNGKEIKQIYTKGANPFFRTYEDIAAELKNDLFPALSGYMIGAIYFFGAGCASPDKNIIVRNAIADTITASCIEINSDLLAAAKGLCGKNAGIACIIGTGSNSCYYDGHNIIENISPLGYILGDEGSGAVIGRLFINACLKNQLTSGLKEQFLDEYSFTTASILDRVYKQPVPNRFLASLSPFILQHISDESVYNLIYNAFKDFFVKNVMQYERWMNTPVHFTGSVAYHYQEVLRESGNDMGINIGTIIQSPMEGLIKYYSEI